jgi:chromosome segregation ATPase
MSKLDAAAERLDKALKALDGRVASLASAQADAAASDLKMAELLSERDVLLARLAELEQDSQSLTAANEDIESRLDSAIGEIRTALGR